MSGGQTRIVEDCYVAPIRVDVFQRIVATIDILVQSVRGIEDSIVRDVDCVGRHPAAHAGGMVARAEVVQPTLAIAFFAAELVVVCVTADTRYKASVRVVVVMLLHVP